MVRGQDVEECRFQHALRMVERHAERRARAAVVAGDEELLETELAHYVYLVLRHAAERVIGVVRLAARLGAVAVAPQVRGNHGETAREARRDALPGEVSERIAVQEQERRPFAAAAPDDRNLGVGSLDVERGEIGHGARWCYSGVVPYRRS